jgi:rSAM/selenodomain-associated transferase 1
MKPGLAIFVKTPDLSPIKTRLAEHIGEPAALAFYRHSVDAVRAVAKACRPFLDPCWAVAEEEGVHADIWADLPALWQGGGGLGERLHTVYSSLLQSHRPVLLIGADAPQLTAELLRRALRKLECAPYLIGKASDGGFWLFGGSQAVPREVWSDVRYSANSTADELSRRLAAHGAIDYLDTLTDVDRAADLLPLHDALGRLHAPLPEQRTLLTGLRAQLPLSSAP